jgi:hypothetical protein
MNSILSIWKKCGHLRSSARVIWRKLQQALYESMSPARDSGMFLACVVHRLVTINSFLREDIIALMEDVGVYGLVHDDVTASKFLRFTGGETETPQARCPRHNIVREWRIIDSATFWGNFF